MKKLRARVLMSMLFLFSVAIPVKLNAQGPLSGEPIIIGVENIDYFPYYRGNGETYTGYARELFEAFARKEAIQIIYKPLPVLRLYAEFFSGEVDFKFPDNPQWNTAERQGKDIHYSAPIAHFVDGVSVPPPRVGQGVEAITKLAVVRGFDPYEWLERIKAEKLRLTQQRDFQTLLQYVIEGRADGAYGNKAVVEYHLRESLRSPGALVFDRTLPFNEGNYHLSTLRQTQVLARFDAWMRANPGIVAQLKARFGVD